MTLYRTIQHTSLGLLAAFVLSACSGDGSTWYGFDEADPPLPGERISVMAHKSAVQVDNELASMKVALPGKRTNRSWSFQRIAPVEHPALSNTPNRRQAESVVAGAEDGVRLTSAPVIAENTIFILGANGRIVALDAGNIEQERWSLRLPQPEAPGDLTGIGLEIVSGMQEQEFLGGNIAYDGGRLYVTTRRGDVFAIHAKKGEILWQRNIKLPIKSSPIVAGNKLIFITNDNRLYVLDSSDGETKWFHSGMVETTSIYSAPSPAANDDVVIAPYSSGEVHVLNSDDGQVIWSDVLTSSAYRRHSSILLSGNTTPVLAGEVVYVTSHDGVLSAYQWDNGKRLWRQDFTGTQSPWVAGEFLYLVTIDYDLICLHAESGKVRRVTS